MTLEERLDVNDRANANLICTYTEELLKKVQSDNSMETTKTIMNKINSLLQSCKTSEGTLYEAAITVSLVKDRPDLVVNLGVIAASRNLTVTSRYVGYALINLGKSEAAEAYFRYTIKQEPSNAKAYDGLACSLFSQGRFEEAMKISEKTIKLEPQKYAYWLLNLGISADLAQKHDVAIHAYTQAIKLDPKNFEPYWQLYDIYEKQKRHQDMDSIIKTARQNVDHDIMEDFIKKRFGDAKIITQ